MPLGQFHYLVAVDIELKRETEKGCNLPELLVSYRFDVQGKQFWIYDSFVELDVKVPEEDQKVQNEVQVLTEIGVPEKEDEILEGKLPFDGLSEQGKYSEVDSPEILLEELVRQKGDLLQNCLS